MRQGDIQLGFPFIHFSGATTELDALIGDPRLVAGARAWDETLEAFVGFNGATWEEDTGGVGAVDSINGQTGVVVLDPDDLDDSATTHKFTSAADITKLAGIEAGAQVNVPETDSIALAALSAHESDTTDAHDASAISNVPAGNISSTHVQGAINELDTEKASIAYVDNAVTGLLDFKGATDCSANPNYPSALKGDSYVVSVAGKIGGASGKTVGIGDFYVAIADNAGGTEASVGTSWTVMENNIRTTDDVIEGSTNKYLTDPNLRAVIAGATSATPTDADYLVFSKTVGGNLRNSLFSTFKDSYLRPNLDTIYASITGAIPNHGWITVSDSWTRTGNHTYTITGIDLTATYRKGAKVRYKDGGAFEYGVIGSSSFAGSTTTVNLIPNSDYAMAAATITDRYISYIENPEGWPHLLNYTAIFSRSGTAFTNAPTLNAATFKVQGNMIIGFIDFTIPASPGGTGEVYASAPVTIVGNRMDVGVEIAVTATNCACYALSSINLLDFYTMASAIISITAGYHYQFNFKYLF